MGFNTFKSIADNYVKSGKPFLPGRKVTVICSTSEKSTERSEAYKEFENVLFLATNVFNQLASRNRKPIIIVGGAKLYQSYRPSMIIATHVDMEVKVPDPVADKAVPDQATKPTHILYPYFDKLKSEFIGMSFSSLKSSTGLDFQYSVYLCNY